MTGYVAYYAVIPAHVLRDTRISASAKLLYGEISVRCNEKGYCWATNRALADDLRLGERTVTRLVSELERAGAVRIDVVGAADTKGNRERRIFLSEAPKISIAKIGDTANFGDTRLDKNGETVTIPSCVTSNVTLVNNKRIMQKKQKTGFSIPDWKPERFIAFWNFYRTNVRGDARGAAVRAWDKLKPDDELIDAIGRALRVQLASDLWQAGYGLPYASTYLNQRRWEDVDTDTQVERPPDKQRGEAIGEWH